MTTDTSPCSVAGRRVREGGGKPSLRPDLNRRSFSKTFKAERSSTKVPGELAGDVAPASAKVCGVVGGLAGGVTAVPGLSGTWAGAAWAGAAWALAPEQWRRCRDTWCRSCSGCDAEMRRAILMLCCRGYRGRRGSRRCRKARGWKTPIKCPRDYKASFYKAEKSSRKIGPLIIDQ